MARDKIGARKSAAVNPDIDGRLSGGDEFSLGGLVTTPLAQQANGPAPQSISITTGSLTYSQNFDSLANTGTSSTVPTDWAFLETLGSANTIYTAGTGSGTTGDTYSFGSTAATDRALGQLRSGSVATTIGAQFTNSIGGTISGLSIGYTGEQWRLGATGRVDRMDFQISFDATSLSNGTWYDVNSLDFTAPVTAGTVGALDGNAAANRTAISAVLSNLSIAQGATFWIRWVDLDATGSDDGLGIDDFSLSVVNTAPMAMIQQTIAASTAVSPPGNGGREFAGLAGLTGGGYVVVWDSTESDADGAGVMAQRYDASGAALGGATLINTATAGYQGYPAVTSTSDGGYIVAWQSAGQDGGGFGIYAQRFDASGVAQGTEFRVNTTVAGDQEQIAMAGLSGGGFVITWDGNGAGDTQGIFAQRYDANGVALGGEVLVNGSTGLTQLYPSIAALTGGGYVITWQSSDANGSGVFAQRFSAGGVAQGGETLINSTTTGTQETPSIAALANGGYVIVWTGAGFGEAQGIFAQRFDANGVAQGGEFSVNTWSTNSDISPAVAALADGGFLVTWTSGSTLTARRFASDGTALGASFQVATSVSFGSAYTAGVAGFADGSYGVAWSTGNVLLSRYATTLSATEQAATSLKGAIVVGNSDSTNGAVTVTLAVGYGILNVTAGTSGAAVSGSGTNSVQLTGTLAQIQSLLTNNGTSTVNYYPDTDAPPASTTLTVTVNDGGNTGSGGALNASTSTTIAIAAENDAPVATILTDPLSATEQVTLDLKGSMTVSDADAGSGIVTVTIQVNDGVLNGTAGSTGVSVSGDGTDTLTLSGTLAQVQAFLSAGSDSSFGYYFGGDAPPADTALTLTIDDGGNSGAGGALQSLDLATINIAAVNDAPALNAAGTGNPYTEDSGTPTQLFASAAATTVESGQNFVSLTMTVTNLSGNAAEILHAGSGQIALVDGSATIDGVLVSVSLAGSLGTVTFTLPGFDTAALAAWVESLAYSNDLDAQDGPSRLFTLTEIVDSGPGGGSPDVNTTALNIFSDVVIIGSQDDPTGASNTIAITEDNSYVLTFADFGYGDPDGDAMSGLYIVGNVITGGTLYLNGNPLDGNSNFVTKTQIDAGALVFVPTADGFGTAYGSFSFQVRDSLGNLDQTYRSITFDISGTPDPALITGTDTGTVSEDGTTNATGTLVANDPDGDLGFQGSDQLGTYGAFELQSNGGWGYTLFNNAGNVQALAQGEQVFDVFHIQSADGTTHDVTITINGNNDDPTAADNTVTTLEDTAYVLTFADFAYADVDGDAMSGLYIVGNVITGGTLLLNGVPLDGNSNFVTKAQIDAGELVFVPIADGNGAGYGAFSFQVRDSNGGLDQAAPYHQITIDVTAQNDAATIGGVNSGDVTEDGTLTATGALTVTDPDSGENQVQAIAAGTAGANGYGTFEVLADGSWTYILNNGLAAVQALNDGQTLTDTILVTSQDGTDTETITVTIHG
ncbi:beta strand repeat-containing protein, partial [Allosphingosinicella sp.]|uniref:beta strand repeat-containing protein n=1 Tax=Allosphingosinicella sp. TaxID=2823234 RepID=UPI003784F2FE